MFILLQRNRLEYFRFTQQRISIARYDQLTLIPRASANQSAVEKATNVFPGKHRQIGDQKKKKNQFCDRIN